MIFTRLILAGAGVGLIMAWPTAAHSQLPDEHTIPGAKRPAVNWPSEHEMPPGSGLQQDTHGGREQPAWPDENTVPAALTIDDVHSRSVFLALEGGPWSGLRDGEVDNDLHGPLGRKPADQPWLRFNLQGHTAPIRALVFSHDGQRLFSAGEDKTVEVWNRMPDPQWETASWAHERTLRWQIHRGLRGRVHALAASDDVLAFAGYGAMEQTGEIMLVEPQTGRLSRALMDTEHGNQQVVVSQVWGGADGQRWLASADVAGRIALWNRDPQTGLWQAATLVPDDVGRYGQPTAQALQPMRRFVPIARAGVHHLFAPRMTGRETIAGREDPVTAWSLERIDVRTGQSQAIPGPRSHYHMLTAIAANQQGDRVISADAWGQVFFWDLATARPQAVIEQQNAAAIAAALSDDGRTLVLGLARSPGRNEQGTIQIWDVSQIQRPRRVWELAVPFDVMAVAVQPGGEWFSYAVGNDVVLRSIQRPKEIVQTMSVPLRAPLRVAFAKQGPPYRMALGYASRNDGRVPLTMSFDSRAGQLAERPANEADWMNPEAGRGDWTLETRRTVDGPRYGLAHRGAWSYELPLRAERHGEPTTACWIADDAGQPWGVAIGTNGQNNIWVYRLSAEAPIQLWRGFRGHQAEVTSLGVSHDGRYLLSGSRDGTAGVWKLDAFADEEPMIHRWGATFAADEQVEVASIRPEGPLHFRGMRQGDVIVRVHWHDGQAVQTATTPEEIIEALGSTSFDTMVAFEYRRATVDQPAFLLYPAWQPLASLVVADNREWAFWSSEGYYNASFEGHKLFGWQINQGVNAAPDFFLAAQMKDELERPEVMSRLLEAGNLPEAFRLTGRVAPAHAEEAVVAQYRLKPRIELLTPRPDAAAPQGDPWVVEADITVRTGQTLVAPKAFANGVPALSAALVESETVEGGMRHRYRWDLAVPSDRAILIQVLAATDSRVEETASLVVHRDLVPPRDRGRLFVLSMGVNDYQDAQIQRLQFATANASSLVDVIQRHAEPLYQVGSLQLLNERATRWLFREVRRQMLDRLQREVAADDLVVIFLSGHGVRDEASDQYYYVTANARYADLRRGRYADCLSFEDLAAFGQLPCRKLVILDTCHSGAVQPQRLQQLRAAVRALQGDLVLTLTASEGSEEAAEERERRLGRFTFHLLEALRGHADLPAEEGNGDSIVTWDEIIRYVRRKVAEDSVGDSVQQHPVAGPMELMPYVHFPVTSARGER